MSRLCHSAKQKDRYKKFKPIGILNLALSKKCLLSQFLGNNLYKSNVTGNFIYIIKRGADLHVFPENFHPKTLSEDAFISVDIIMYYF